MEPITFKQKIKYLLWKATLLPGAFYLMVVMGFYLSWEFIYHKLFEIKTRIKLPVSGTGKRYKPQYRKWWQFKWRDLPNTFPRGYDHPNTAEYMIDCWMAGEPDLM